MAHGLGAPHPSIHQALRRVRGVLFRKELQAHKGKWLQRYFLLLADLVESLRDSLQGADALNFENQKIEEACGGWHRSPIKSVSAANVNMNILSAYRYINVFRAFQNETI